MLTWSTASTLKPNLQRCHSKAAENFLQSWDSAVYEGEAMKDTVLNKEASLWSEKFPHLRVVGVNCDGQGARMKKKTALGQSKSALTFREKSRETSLPRIDKFRKNP
uniref:DUF3719 domain-containing protein n=1 Tax=Caenorhabditis japonica TaxID=281687 RepID=A0A8R1DUD9_CAEJA